MRPSRVDPNCSLALNCLIDPNGVSTPYRAAAQLRLLSNGNGQPTGNFVVEDIFGANPITYATTNAVTNAAYNVASTANSIAWDLYYLTRWY